ncbi:MAG: DUF4932 domain-containing protein [Spirochaetales bacterium]|nr:DUF4932 domain-containing protein [Spirochaetales bacterium]
MNKLKIYIDDNLELMGVLSHLSTYDKRFRDCVCPGEPGCGNILYKKAVEFFSPWKNHRAVDVFDTITACTEWFGYDAPVKLFLSPQMRSGDYSEEFDAELRERCEKPEHLAEMVEAARAFRTESSFASFMKENKTTYDAIVSDVAGLIGDTDYIAILEEYLGLSKPGYNLALAPLLIGNYGIRFGEGDRVETFAVVTPVMDDKLYFGDRGHIAGMFIHEFLHSFINGLTDRYMKQNPDRHYNVEVTATMIRQAYPRTAIIINESVIRAITHRLETTFFGKEHAERALSLDKKRGFVYVDGIVRKLDTYEKNRSECPDIGDYYHEIMAEFEKLEKE